MLVITQHKTLQLPLSMVRTAVIALFRFLTRVTGAANTLVAGLVRNISANIMTWLTVFSIANHF